MRSESHASRKSYLGSPSRRPASEESLLSSISFVWRGTGGRTAARCATVGGERPVVQRAAQLGRARVCEHSVHRVVAVLRRELLGDRVQRARLVGRALELGSQPVDRPLRREAALTAKLAALNIYERVTAAQRQREQEEAVAKSLVFATNDYVSGAVGSILDEIDLYGLSRV